MLVATLLGLDLRNRDRGHSPAAIELPRWLLVSYAIVEAVLTTPLLFLGWYRMLSVSAVETASTLVQILAVVFMVVAWTQNEDSKSGFIDEWLYLFGIPTTLLVNLLGSMSMKQQ
ncbi:hypothetical protein T484DRAFT_1860961, partial [Baffinella frigidus]